MNKEMNILQTDNDKLEITTYKTEGCVIHTVCSPISGKLKVHQSISYSEDNQFHKIITGEFYNEAMEILITAVNNRTRERNFFKLFCDLLDQSISEEEFDEIIDKNEDNYIVCENENPDPNKVYLALKLSKRIKDVKSINDFSSLFSFNPNSIEQLAIE